MNPVPAPEPSSPDVARRRFLKAGVALGAALAAGATRSAAGQPASDDPSRVVGGPMRPYGDRSGFEDAVRQKGLKLRAPRQITHPVFGRVYDEEDDRQGVIALSRKADAALVAHELGHAVTTAADRDRRNSPDDEWAAELAADYHAYQWGFGRAIARQRPTRSLGHHAVGPGQWVGVGGDLTTGEGMTWYRVSRRFVMHRTEAPATR